MHTIGTISVKKQNTLPLNVGKCGLEGRVSCLLKAVFLPPKFIIANFMHKCVNGIVCLVYKNV